MGSKIPGPAPVIDNVAQTVTFTTAINTAASVPQSGFLYSNPGYQVGNYVYTTAGTHVSVKAFATLSPSLAGQESKFHLYYRNGVYGINFYSLGEGALGPAYSPLECIHGQVNELAGEEGFEPSIP